MAGTPGTGPELTKRQESEVDRAADDLLGEERKQSVPRTRGKASKTTTVRVVLGKSSVSAHNSPESARREVHGCDHPDQATAMMQVDLALLSERTLVMREQVEVVLHG